MWAADFHTGRQEMVSVQHGASAWARNGRQRVKARRTFPYQTTDELQLVAGLAWYDSLDEVIPSDSGRGLPSGCLYVVEIGLTRSERLRFARRKRSLAQARALQNLSDPRSSKGPSG